MSFLVVHEILLPQSKSCLGGMETVSVRVNVPVLEIGCRLNEWMYS